MKDVKPKERKSRHGSNQKSFAGKNICRAEQWSTSSIQQINFLHEGICLKSDRMHSAQGSVFFIEWKQHREAILKRVGTRHYRSSYCSSTVRQSGLRLL